MQTQGFLDRVRGALFLDIDTYEEVEADESATMQAAVVVLTATVASAIGASGMGEAGIIGAAIRSVGGWLIWAAVTHFIGSFLGGTSTWGELLRTLGFAQAPGILAVVGIVPFLGWMIFPVVAIWGLVCGIVAIRQALDVDTVRAVVVAVIGWMVVWIPMLFFRGILRLFGL